MNKFAMTEKEIIYFESFFNKLKDPAFKSQKFNDHEMAIFTQKLL